MRSITTAAVLACSFIFSVLGSAASAAKPAFGLVPVVCEQAGGTVTSRFVNIPVQQPVNHFHKPPNKNFLIVLDINTLNGNCGWKKWAGTTTAGCLTGTAVTGQGLGSCISGVKCFDDLAGASVTGVNGQPFQTLVVEMSGDCSRCDGPQITAVGTDSNGTFAIAAFFCDSPTSSAVTDNGFVAKLYTRNSIFFSPCCSGIPVTLTKLFIAEGPGQHSQIRNVVLNGVQVAPQLNAATLDCQDNFTADPCCTNCTK